MRAGQLRHQLQIQSPYITQDDDGGQLVAWADVGPPVWGRIEPLRSAERLLAAQVSERQTHRITLRYVPLPTDYRLILCDTPTRIFEPTSVRNLEERERTLEVFAVENVVDNGTF